MSFQKFKEKVNAFELKLREIQVSTKNHVSNFKQNHPYATRFIDECLPLIPSPFNLFAQIIWSGSNATDEDKSEEILSYLKKIVNSNEENYEKIIEAISPLSEGIKEIVQTGAKQDTLVYVKATVDEMKEKINYLVQVNDQKYYKERKRPDHYRDEVKDFVGRDNYITKIITLLQEYQNPIVISGMGGMGKTALAIKCIRTYEENLDTVIPIYFQTERKYEQVLLGIWKHLELKIDEFKGDDEETTDSIYKALAKIPKPLLFIDNYETVTDSTTDTDTDSTTATDNQKIHIFLQGVPKNVLILATSRRNQNHFKKEEIIDLKKMTPDEGVQLFIDEANIPEPSDDVLEMIREIVISTDALPLTIAIIAGNVGHVDAGGIKQSIESFNVNTKNLRKGGRLLSLQNCFEYSYSRLDIQLQKKFPLLCYFHSPFNQESSEFVFSLTSDEVQELHNRNLIQNYNKHNEKLIDKKYFFYHIHPAIREFLKEKTKSKKISMKKTHKEKLCNFYADFIDDVTKTIDNDENDEILNIFLILSEGKNNEIETVADFSKQFFTKKKQASLLSKLGTIYQKLEILDKSISYIQKAHSFHCR